MQVVSSELVKLLVSLTKKLENCQIDYTTNTNTNASDNTNSVGDDSDEEKKKRKYDHATRITSTSLTVSTASTVLADEVGEYLQDLNLCHQLSRLRAHLLQWIPEYWMSEWKDKARQFVNNLDLLSGKKYLELCTYSTTASAIDSKVVVKKTTHQYDSDSDDDKVPDADDFKRVNKNNKYLLLTKSQAPRNRGQLTLEFLESNKFKELKSSANGKIEIHSYWHRNDFYKFRKIVGLEVLPLNLWWLLFRQLILFFHPEKADNHNYFPGALIDSYGDSSIPAEENTWAAYVHLQHYHPELYPELDPQKKLNTELQTQLQAQAQIELVDEFSPTNEVPNLSENTAAEVGKLTEVFVEANKICSRWFTMKDWKQCSKESSFGLWNNDRKLLLKNLLIEQQTRQIIDFFFPDDNTVDREKRLVASQVAARLEFQRLNFVASDGAYKYDKVAGYNFYFRNCLPSKTCQEVLRPEQRTLYWSENENCSGSGNCANCHRFGSNHSVIVNHPVAKLDMEPERFTIVYRDQVPELKIASEDVQKYDRYCPLDYFSSWQHFVDFVEWILCCQEENDSYYRGYLSGDFPTMNDNLKDLDNFRTFSTTESIRKHRQLVTAFELSVRHSGQLPTALASLSSSYLEAKLFSKYHP